MNQATQQTETVQAEQPIETPEGAPAQRRFDDWAIVCDGRTLYIGKITGQDDEDGSVLLEPAYEWIVQFMGGPGGKFSANHIAFPLGGLAGVTWIVVIPQSMQSLNSITTTDENVIGNAIDHAEETRNTMKGKEATSKRLIVPAPRLQ